VAILTLMATRGYADKLGPINDPTNEPPSAGTVIYSVTGQTISSTYQTGTANFTAGSTTTNIAFAFREDPAFLELADVSLINLTTGSLTNLMVNGDFSAGPVGSSAPSGWSYLNSFGASFGGVLDSGCGPSGGNCYFDGAVQAYDAINQLVTTISGDQYQLSFEYADDCPGACGTGGGVTTYQPVSTNGDVSDTAGNGRDMYVYAANTVITAATPEPSSFILLATLLATLAILIRFPWIRLLHRFRPGRV
jgi:hypothetical protein